MMSVPRPPQGTVERFKALGDATGIISDSMDELGIPGGVIGATVLRPTMPGTTMVGPATTLRNRLQRIDPLQGARDHVNKMAEFESHNLATPGDVLVIQGVPNISNMGGISAQTGKRHVEAAEINGPVQIGDVKVTPGDLVVADDTGVCFIPRDHILEVLELAEKKSKAEDSRCKAIDNGMPVPEISHSSYGEK